MMELTILNFLVSFGPGYLCQPHSELNQVSERTAISADCDDHTTVELILSLTKITQKLKR